MPRDRRGAGELTLLARRGSGHPPSDLDRPCRLATSDRLDGRCLPSGVRGTPLGLPAFPSVHSCGLTSTRCPRGLLSGRVCRSRALVRLSNPLSQLITASVSWSGRRHCRLWNGCGESSGNWVIRAKGPMRSPRSNATLTPARSVRSCASRG